MNTIFECRSFHWGQIEIPPLCASPGDFVCLHLPPVTSPLGKGEWGESDLGEYLAGTVPHPAIAVAGLAIRVARPLPPPGFLGRWRNPKLKSWLAQHAALLPVQVDQTFERFALPNNTRLCDLSWTLRSEVVLYAAILRRPALLVFDTMGLGDDGVAQIYSLAARRESSITAICLAHPRGRPRLCFPDARCISLNYFNSARTSAA